MNNSQNAIAVQQQQPHPTQQNQMQGQHANFVPNQAAAPQPPQQTTVQNVQQQPASSQSHMSSNPNATNQEMLNKTRKLIADLKESLANLMNLAAKNINYNYQIDSGQKLNMEKCSRFDKAWGEFNSICNQVETHFQTFHECSLLRKESKNYVPHNLAALSQVEQGNANNENLISYNQYLSVVKNQVHFTKQIQDILTEGARKISQMEIQPMMQQQNLHGQQHGYHPIQQQQPQANMITQQHQMQQQQHPYHTQPHSNQMPSQSPMSNHQSPIANHQSPISQSMGQSPMMSQQMMMNQRGPMTPMSQMGNQMGNQMNSPMPVQQQPMMQPMHLQMNNQMNSNQMKQPHNQM